MSAYVRFDHFLSINLNYKNRKKKMNSPFSVSCSTRCCLDWRRRSGCCIFIWRSTCKETWKMKLKKQQQQQYWAPSIIHGNQLNDLRHKYESGSLKGNRTPTLYNSHLTCSVILPSEFSLLSFSSFSSSAVLSALKKILALLSEKYTSSNSWKRTNQNKSKTWCTIPRRGSNHDNSCCL